MLILESGIACMSSLDTCRLSQLMNQLMRGQAALLHEQVQVFAIAFKGKPQLFGNLKIVHLLFDYPLQPCLTIGINQCPG